MKITSWEHADLLEQLHSREDIWTSSMGGSLWLRSSPDWTSGTEVVTNGMGLRIIPPQGSGPYRLFDVSAIPMDWESSTCDEYLDELLSYWTSYGLRKRLEAFLVEQKQDPKTAYAFAIGLARIVQDPDLPPDEPQTPARLPDVLQPLSVELTSFTPHSNVFLLSGGGHLKLAFQGGCFKVSLFIPSARSGGYGPPLEGYVRAYSNLPARDIAASIFGWEEATHEDNKSVSISDRPDHESESNPDVPQLPTDVLLDVRGGVGPESSNNAPGGGQGNS